MSKLLPEESVRNPQAEEPWKRREGDRMLDMHFEGVDIVRLAAKIGRNPYAIKKKLDEYVYNERNRIVDYQPKQRISRKGKRLTDAERKLIRSCIKQGIDLEHAARVLMRDLSEISTKDQEQVVKNKEVAASLDLVLAYRYIYHQYKFKLISNKAYDNMKAEEMEYGGGVLALSTKECPDYVKSLALYLVGKHEWTHGKIKQ